MVVCSGNDAGNAIALTFDDGPLSPYTEAILDAFDEHGAHGTFFVRGLDTRPPPPPPPPLKTMITAVDPYPVPFRQPVEVLVTAQDEATGQPILGADVQIGVARAGETGTRMGSRVFRPRAVRDPADPEEVLLIGPTVTVHQPGFESANVDCGW